MPIEDPKGSGDKGLPEPKKKGSKKKKSAGAKKKAAGTKKKAAKKR